MPRPLHEPNNRNPTKIQKAFATPVGADRCVGPLRTCRFRPRAHTQVRPYKATKQYGDIKHVRCLCRVEACLDRRSRKRAGRPSADRRSELQGQTSARAPREAVWGAGALPLPITQASREALRRPVVLTATPNSVTCLREAVRQRPLAAREAVRLRPLAATPPKHKKPTHLRASAKIDWLD